MCLIINFSNNTDFLRIISFISTHYKSPYIHIVIKYNILEIIKLKNLIFVLFT